MDTFFSTLGCTKGTCQINIVHTLAGCPHKGNTCNAEKLCNESTPDSYPQSFKFLSSRNHRGCGYSGIEAAPPAFPERVFGGSLVGLGLGNSPGFGKYRRVLKHRQADWLGCGAISITGVIVRTTRINFVARRRQLRTSRDFVVFMAALGTSCAFSRLVGIIVANLMINHHPILARDRDNVIVRSMGDLAKKFG